jgi:hypothetical protein
MASEFTGNFTAETGAIECNPLEGLTSYDLYILTFLLVTYTSLFFIHPQVIWEKKKQGTPSVAGSDIKLKAGTDGVPCFFFFPKSPGDE